MLRIVLILLTTLQAAPQTGTQDEIKDALAHAEALYYGARFTESSALLTRIDDSLKSQPARLPERISTKLRLALVHIGLNDPAKAKGFLMDLFALDPDYVLDPKQFSPKVMAVANEAKAEQTKIQCQAAQESARSYLESAKTTALIDLMRSSKSRCSGLAAMEPEMAEALYKSGLAAYKQNEFSTALTKFQAAVTLAPAHELSLQYIDLVQNKMQLSQDRLVLQWQKSFDARQLSAAAADYKQIVALNDARSASAKTHVTGEYRKALTSLVETWNRTCPSGDLAAMNSIRNQISELLPEPSFGEDIRARMVPCPEPSKAVAAGPTKAVVASPNDEAGPKPAPANDAPAANACFEMQSQLALTRLKSRVDPVLPADVRYYLKNTAQVVVRVKTKISESGDVTVLGVTDGNPILNSAVRNAVTEWKFVPVRDSSGPRCVLTEIPIVIKLQ
jgi:hypothetical protein